MWIGVDHSLEHGVAIDHLGHHLGGDHVHHTGHRLRVHTHTTHTSHTAHPTHSRVAPHSSQSTEPSQPSQATAESSIDVRLWGIGCSIAFSLGLRGRLFSFYNFDDSVEVFSIDEIERGEWEIVLEDLAWMS